MLGILPQIVRTVRRKVSLRLRAQVFIFCAQRLDRASAMFGGKKKKKSTRKFYKCVNTNCTINTTLESLEYASRPSRCKECDRVKLEIKFDEL